MNISGSLSIKTATIGGKANGSYVDSDKFKSSDINFHLQVKVTNQVVEPGNYCIFNKIPHIPTEKFNEVYGVSSPVKLLKFWWGITNFLVFGYRTLLSPAGNRVVS